MAAERCRVELDISQLRAAAGDKLTFSCQQRMDVGAEGFSFPEPVAVWGTVLNTGVSYLVEGHLRATVESCCARCLAPFRQTVEADFQEEFREGDPPPPGQEEVSRVSDAEVQFFRGDKLILDEVVRQHLLLALPSQPLCRPDCPGLCPVCGRRLEEGECSCQVREVDPRLEPLRRWLTKGE